MKFYIVIPAHNEASYIGLTLQSLASQTLLPKKVIVVNDNSTDETKNIIDEFEKKHQWLTVLTITSSNKHLPGSKIINAFYKGFNSLDDDYDVICKFDADLIFPDNYLETLAKHFNKDKKIGMASGYCYVEKNNKWEREKITGKKHIRGALKAYRKDCFIEIGKLKNDMGWDTIDELLAKFYNWEIVLDDNLIVKHLKPTGQNYGKQARFMHGEAMYKMRYGIILTFIIGVFNGFKRKSFATFNNFVYGYFKAKRAKLEPFITEKQGRFVRQERWKDFRDKIGL